MFKTMRLLWLSLRLAAAPQGSMPAPGTSHHDQPTIVELHHGKTACNHRIGQGRGLSGSSRASSANPRPSRPAEHQRLRHFLGCHQLAHEACQRRSARYLKLHPPVRVSIGDCLVPGTTDCQNMEPTQVYPPIQSMDTISIKYHFFVWIDGHIDRNRRR